MAGKKFYAVKRGKVTGVFKTWEECRESVEGYPGAEYKGFPSRSEAYAYLGISEQSGEAEEGYQTDGAGDRADRVKGKKQYPADAAERPPAGWLLAYVDGSYEDSLKKYAFGCVFFTPEGHIYTQYGNGDREQSLQHRNVTGEMLGAMYAVKTAMVNGFRGIEVRYDYQGIEKWVTGEWRSKTELTQKYAHAMRDWGRDIEIRFQKVAAHTNVRYNELADSLAKKGLREGNGVPKVVPLKEMEEYCEE
ncbi:MAG: ribonuclease H family protein [Butyrivibrio sp.]|nr:ribonuclease H family protein [Acetatifactor muris]MCM1559449.1 ribonuclease H family protein [Butyrivibrio sp.]